MSFKFISNKNMHNRHHVSRNIGNTRYLSAKQKGFTLIELLVVIAIIGVLAAVVMASLAASRQKADDSKRLQDMTQLKNAFEIYATKHNGAYPAVATNGASKNYFAANENKALTFVSGLLSFASRPAYAAGNHTNTACSNFDTMASALVADGDLSAVPADPHDDADTYCYKAWTDGDSVAVWAYTWQKYKNVSTGSSEAANKHVGFIVTRHSELNRAKLVEICTATNSAPGYGDADTYPVINPYSSSTLCGGGPTPDDGLIADVILGISTGDETVITNSNLVANGGSCTINADCQSSNCASSVCSPQLLGNGESCTANEECLSTHCVNGVCHENDDGGGTCDPDHQYDNTDQGTCEGHGSCSEATYTEGGDCTSAGNCSNGSSNVTSSYCTEDLGGTCSAGGYTNATTCVYYGYCSNGSFTDQGGCPVSEGSSWCSGGSHDENSCSSYGDCNNGTSDITAADCYDNYGGSYWFQYNWKTQDAVTWTQNYWTPYYSWTPYVWTPNQWTSSN